MSPVGEIARGQALSAGSNATNPVALRPTQAIPQQATSVNAPMVGGMRDSTMEQVPSGDGYIIDKNGVKQWISGLTGYKGVAR
jgi:hypothetical protein